VDERALLDLVALGTVADLAPLLGENRQLVKQGLEVLNEARREGIRALLRMARVRPGNITAATIGYGLGPRLNAAGRLQSASLSYKLLITTDSREARGTAARLDDLNQRRQAQTAKQYAQAEDLALAQGPDVPILFAAHEDFHPGIVGLVAGRLTDSYYRPSVVIRMGDGECRGSCRSIPEFHISKALDECRDLLVRHGGHAAAAGFSVRPKHLDELQRRLLAIGECKLGGRELSPKLEIDAETSLEGMTSETMDWLGKLEPCGERNPVPQFLSRNVPVTEWAAVGREEQHLRLVFPEGTEVRDAIGFGLGDCAEWLSQQRDQRVDIVYSLAVNEWNGDSRLQLHLRDVRPSTTAPGA
jgi:single-stranded-DNA-specific exonuclease